VLKAADKKQKKTLKTFQMHDLSDYQFNITPNNRLETTHSQSHTLSITQKRKRAFTLT